MFDWSDEKDAWLREERGIGFQEIVFHLEGGGYLGESRHPNHSKYPKQRVYFVRVVDYVYLVPFVETETGVFLKTIIPSRKYTRRFLR